MKFKHLLIVSFILAILTIGAVSASDDIATDDALTVNEDTEDIRVFDEDAMVGTSDVESDNQLKGSDDAADIQAASENDDVLGAEPIEVHVYSGTLNINSADDDEVGYVRDSSGISGTISVSFDGSKRFVKNINIPGYKEFYIYGCDLNLPASTTGSHAVSISYVKNGATYSDSRNINVLCDPYLSIISTVATGENSRIIVDTGAGTVGNAILYNADENYNIGSVIANVLINNGYARFDLNKLSKGMHYYVLKLTVNGKSYTYNEDILARDNSAGYSASVSSKKITVGDNVVVSFKGSATRREVTIYVDGEITKKASLRTGVVKEVISGLSVGTHKIIVRYHKGNDFFFKSFTITVKDKPVIITLKKVTVKKSAKKLVLKATLKKGTKALKKVKVTFKFKGKKYKAKTNKKGVAKVTIKKSVLKKLKVGKKVKYQVSYGKKTVKRTVKVKK